LFPYIAGYLTGRSGLIVEAELLRTLTVMGWVVSWCGNFFGFVGLVLGAVSVAREEKKVFGILGLVFGLALTCVCLATVAYNLSRL
jgi:hypothetical protein